MRMASLRPAGRHLVALLCAAFLLSTTLGAVSRAVAADESWETWPKKASEPAVEPTAPPPPTPSPPAADTAGPDKSWMTWPVKPPASSSVRVPPAGKEAAEKPARGRSYGTVVWVALGIAAAIGIGIAVASGGGGDGGGTVVNPGHH